MTCSTVDVATVCVIVVILAARSGDVVAAAAGWVRIAVTSGTVVIKSADVGVMGSAAEVD